MKARCIAAVTACLGALIVVPSLAWGVSGFESASEPPQLNLLLAPQHLPKHQYAPARLSLGFRWALPEVDRPPPVSEFAVKLDRSVAIDLESYPRCPYYPHLQVNPPFDFHTCSKAIVGKGELRAFMRFPETAPYQYRTKLVVYLRSRRGRESQLFGRAEITVPTPTTLIVPVGIDRRHDGHPGTEATFTIPTIAGGAGSLTSLVLHLGRGIGYRNTRHSIVSARCPSGMLRASGRVRFGDESEVEESIAPEPCIGVEEPPAR